MSTPFFIGLAVITLASAIYFAVAGRWVMATVVMGLSLLSLLVVEQVRTPRSAQAYVRVEQERLNYALKHDGHPNIPWGEWVGTPRLER